VAGVDLEGLRGGQLIWKGSGVGSSKRAVTLRAWAILTLQVPVPEHDPLQPSKVEPLAGVAVRVILVPDAKLLLHVLPQLIPEGLLVTVPLPKPVLYTERV